MPAKVTQNVKSIAAGVTNLKSALQTFVARLKNAEGNNFELGRSYLERGQLKDAAFRFLLVTKINPAHVDAWAQLALVQAKQGAKEKTRKTLATLKQKAPTHASIRDIEAVLA